jgi:hypothetical protein
MSVIIYQLFTNPGNLNLRQYRFDHLNYCKFMFLLQASNLSNSNSDIKLF